MIKLSKENTGLLIIDVQEKLFPLVEQSCHVEHKLQQVVKGFRVLGLPIVFTEQYPQGLGRTIPSLLESFDDRSAVFMKTSFSSLGDPQIKQYLLEQPIHQWVLVGIEAHVCVLQTAKDLIAENKEVVVLNDAISSRSIYDFSTAIAELRDENARITSVETVLFELLGDAQAPEFQQISQLVK